MLTFEGNSKRIDHRPQSNERFMLSALAQLMLGPP
jgi:hypothetical protein